LTREPAIRVTLSQICDKMDARFDRLEAKLEERQKEIDELRGNQKYFAGGIALLGFFIMFFKDPVVNTVANALGVK